MGRPGLAELPFSEPGPGLEGSQGLDICKRKVKSHYLTSQLGRRTLPTPHRTQVSCLLTLSLHRTEKETGAQKVGLSGQLGEGPEVIYSILCFSGFTDPNPRKHTQPHSYNFKWIRSSVPPTPELH